MEVQNVNNYIILWVSTLIFSDILEASNIKDFFLCKCLKTVTLALNFLPMFNTDLCCYADITNFVSKRQRSEELWAYSELMSWIDLSWFSYGRN